VIWFDIVSHAEQHINGRLHNTRAHTFSPLNCLRRLSKQQVFASHRIRTSPSSWCFYTLTNIKRS